MCNKFDYIIVGGGIVGAATAYKLQLKFKDKSIAILEKESELAMHQTGRNSGVIHSGIYYTPNSYKARNCKNGRDQLVNFVKEHQIKHDICGKVIVATTKEEVIVLDAIFQKGIENGTPGIRFLNSEEIKEKEPFIEGVKAIWVPSAGIVDFVGVTKKFAELITELQPKSNVFTNCKVLDLYGSKLETTLGTFTAEKIIVCGGLFADRLATKGGANLDLQIVGFRGDYYKLTEQAKHKVKNLIYPTPDPKFPFLGVHFTPMVNSDIECGPNAVFSFKREGYKNTSFLLKDTFQALTYKGTLKLFSKHWRKGLEEYRRAFSKRLFVKELQRMMPSITMNDVTYARAGVRAQALNSKGDLVDDFKIITLGNQIHVLNAPSPAATSCMAIADEIVNQI
ncbi:L-2-hydroxyglutarate oxidase [Urechidicola sp. KH5]